MNYFEGIFQKLHLLFRDIITWILLYYVGLFPNTIKSSKHKLNWLTRLRIQANANIKIKEVLFRP